MRSSSLTVLGLVAVAPLVVLDRAAAEVDVELGSGDRVDARVSSAGGPLVFRADVPAGSSLTLVTKGRGDAGATAPPRPRVRLYHADGAPLAEDAIEATAKGDRLRRFVVPHSGRLRIEIDDHEGRGGRVRARLRWVPPRKFRASVPLSAEPGSYPFSAPAGATASIVVSSRDGSIPRLIDIVDEDGATVHVVGAPGAKSSGDRENGIVLPRTADYRVRFRNDAVGDGSGIVQIRLAPARSSTGRLAIADDADASVALGGVIGPAGGSVGVPANHPSAFAGALVEVPPASLRRARSLVLQAATAFAAPPRPRLVALGPALELGPAGARFDAPVLLTLPFSIDRLNGDAADLVVGRRDDRGRIHGLDAGLVVDASAGTVSFPIDGPDSFAVFGPAPPPVPLDLNGDGKGDLVIPTYSSGDRPASVSVFFSTPEGGAALPPTRSSEADAVLVQATPANDRFACCWTHGDWNADGVSDLAVGEFQFRAGVRLPGRVYVFFGGSAFQGTTDPAADADVVLEGSHAFGVSLASGDVDADGIEDLVVGERNDSRGRVTVIAGAADFGQRRRVLATVTGLFDAEEVGAQVAVGDVVGDGRGDLVLTALSWDREQPYVAVFDGASLEGDLAPGDATATWSGVHPLLDGVVTRPEGGLVVARVTGGVKSDVVFLSVQSDPFVRSVHVFPGGASLASGAIVDSPIQIADHAPAPWSIRAFAVGDVSRDGVPDLIVSADNGLLTYVGGSGTLGPSATTTTTVAAGWTTRIPHTAGTPPFGFGRRVVVQDALGDAEPELIVTDPGESGIGAGNGAAYLFLTNRSHAHELEADATIRGGPGDRFGE